MASQCDLKAGVVFLTIVVAEQGGGDGSEAERGRQHCSDGRTPAADLRAGDTGTDALSLHGRAMHTVHTHTHCTNTHTVQKHTLMCKQTRAGPTSLNTTLVFSFFLLSNRLSLSTPLVFREAPDRKVCG